MHCTENSNTKRKKWICIHEGKKWMKAMFFSKRIHFFTEFCCPGRSVTSLRYRISEEGIFYHTLPSDLYPNLRYFVRIVRIQQLICLEFSGNMLWFTFKEYDYECIRGFFLKKKKTSTMWGRYDLLLSHINMKSFRIAVV